MILCSLKRFCTIPDSHETIKILITCLFGGKCFKFFYIYLLLKNLINKKYFSVKNKFGLVFKKIFFFILDEKYFLEVKILKISYYLLIIINLVLKLLIAIYFVLNFFL
jgi:hypothetical protein